MDASCYSTRLCLPGLGDVRIRSIRPDDKPRLLKAFLSLSPLSVQYRFLQSKKTLTREELCYYTELDFENHVGLVATLGEGETERIICVGRYVVIDPLAPVLRAEFGIAVIDECQHHGIGTSMMDTLMGVARERGVSTFEAYVSGENRGFIAFLEHRGYGVQRTLEAGTIHLSFSILDGGSVEPNARDS
jgi:ribosomal protein S18 acetylase RimI-like enzyme